MVAGLLLFGVGELAAQHRHEHARGVQRLQQVVHGRGDEAGLVTVGLFGFAPGFVQILGALGLEVRGDGLTLNAYALYPWVRSRNLNLFAVASVDHKRYDDSTGGIARQRQVNNLSLGLTGDLRDDWFGGAVSTFEAHLATGDVRYDGGRPDSLDGKSMEPLENHGVQVISIGFLIDKDEAMIWRGPMATQALEQLLRQTNWKDLDYLIVDMPPGTGDIQLTMAQQVPTSAAVIVTTPQDVALADARKGIAMFNKVNVPVLGIIENMSYHVCSACGHHEPLFGTGGGQKMAEQYQVALLGQLPLHIDIRQHMDDGCPTVFGSPEGGLAEAYLKLARRVGAELYFSGKPIATPLYTVALDE